MTPDDQLTRLMDRAVAALEPPTDRLVRGGLERGRRLRRRRRLIQAGSGTALVGLITAIAVSLVPGTTPAGLRAPADHRSSVPAPTPQPVVHHAVAPARVSMSPQLLAHTAIGLLPRPGRISELHGRAFAGNVFAEFVYNDGHGPAQIDVSLGFRQDGADGVVDTCDASDPVYTEICRTAPNGSRLATFIAVRGATQWSVGVIRPDHVQISIGEWNSPQEKDAPVSRPEPPFSKSELEALVTDPSWTPWVSTADNDAVAKLFVPDYSYDQQARRKHRELLERERAAQARAAAKAAADAARQKQRQYDAKHGGH